MLILFEIIDTGLLHVITVTDVQFTKISLGWLIFKKKNLEKIFF